MVSKILIVEDEKEIADTLEYAFSSAGMSVDWVSTGSAAETSLNQNSYQLCLLDIGLPDHDGFELLKNLRLSNNPHRDIPVIFLTARNEEIDRIVGLEIGADDYVCKPFSPREVVARAKAILKRVNSTNSEPEPTISNSPFVVDSKKFIISYQSTSLPLTRSEYNLLCAFLTQPGRVFTRRQLMEKVFSDTHPSDDRAIDTHIKTLRAKLKAENPHQDHIVTHRGFGYSLLI